MEKHIRIKMMGTFTVFVDEKIVENLVGRSKKGVSLMEYLIVNRGTPVPNGQLLDNLWDDEKSSNPENALKTLVSRLRAMLEKIDPDLGNCIASDRGAYHWARIPGVEVDVLELMDIFDRFKRADGQDDIELYKRIMTLYTGDLLQNENSSEWVAPYAVSLHNQYISAVYAYIDILKAQEQYEQISVICRTALDINAFDDRLNIELMTALIKMNRVPDALGQYKHIVHLNYRYLGVQPSEDMQEFYKQIVTVGKNLDFNLESIRNELREIGEQRGAFFCEYAVFKEIYNLQMRNLERLGSTMFLGVIMVGDPERPEPDSIKQDTIMNNLLNILKTNLRKGDTVTQFSPTVFALLLPTVNYATGNMVMERIKYQFFKKYPNSELAYQYRIGPLSSNMEPTKTEN